MKPKTLEPLNSYVSAGGIDSNIWMTSDAGLNTDRLFHDITNTSGYIEAFEDGSDTAGGTSAFLPSFSEAGVVTFFLNSSAPASLAGSISGAKVIDATVSISLKSTNVLDDQQIPMQFERAGDKLTLTSLIPESQRDAVRAILFDSSPDCSIHIEQSVRVATLMTKDFIKGHWDNDKIRMAVQKRLPGFGSDQDADYFLSMLDATGIDYQNLYMFMQATYVTDIQAPALPGFIQRPVNFNGKAYNYYQDNRNPDQVYYLPDSFELGQAPDGSPYVSLLEFQTEKGVLEDMRALFRFYASATTNQSRIEDARSQLKASLARPGVNLLPLTTSNYVKANLSLYLPDESGQTSSKVPRPDASIKLEEGFSDELHLSFKAFQTLWAAIFTGGPEQVVFTGEISVQISGGRFTERVAFNGRMSGGAEREQAYFQQLIKEGKDNRYHIDIDFYVFNSIFAPEGGVGALTMNFGSDYASAPLEFNASDCEEGKTFIQKKITLQRLVSDIILHKDVPDVFEYVMKVIREDGPPTCCTHETEVGGVYVNKSQVADCTCKANDCGCNHA